MPPPLDKAEASLRGARVALLESRMKGELASLVERASGVPYCVPAVVEDRHAHAREVRSAIDWLSAPAPAPRVAVLSTGVGVESLFRQASVLGREEELRAALARATTVCRGPKPVAALKKLGLKGTVRAADPYTTHELLEAIDALADKPSELLLLNYGERNVPLVDALAARAIAVHELSLYEWKLPEDLTPLRRLVDEIVERRVNAVAFTSQIQARHLVHVAEEMHQRDDLLVALSTHTPVAAIGPTCAEALRALGVEARVVPDPPKMGALVQSLARFLTRG
jgi:uroporphyrinogen-III synthase